MSRNTHFKRKTMAVAIAAGSAIAASQTVVAQESSVMEEVIVTASAREQAAEDIPYNISVMQGSALKDQQITDEAELLRAISGISVMDRGYRNSGAVNSIIIRGLNVDNGLNGNITLNAVPTVSTYVDNTPLYANFVLKDLERVEVLRGPQGTLYGSGALGGTVRYITNKPSMDGLEGELSIDYSQTEGSDGDNYNFDAMINVPLGDKIAIRANIGRIDNDGVIDYVNAYQLNSFGEPLIAEGDNCIDPRSASDAQVLTSPACYSNEEDADDAKLDYGRVAIKFDATDNLSILASYQTQEDDVGARRAVTKGNNGQPEDGTYFEYDDHEIGQTLLEPSEREVDLYALDIEWDLGFATLTSNSSYTEHNGNATGDNAGLWTSGGETDPALSRDWYVNFGYEGQPRPAQRADRGFDNDAFIQEIRLISNETRNNIDWLVGAFYLDEDQTVWQNSYNPGMNEFNDACRNTGSAICDNFWPRFYDGLTEQDFEYSRDVTYEEMAVYGELTYHINDAFRVTGGLRWFDVESENDTILGFPLVIGWESPRAPKEEGSDDDILIKLNASYDLNDQHMVYATYSEGYRRGGYNAVPSADDGDSFGEPNAENIRSYEKDEVNNYEIGIKGRTENLSYTVSAFYVDWQDPQLNTATIWYGFYIAQNGDEASTSGIEMELNGYLTDSINYHLGYTYVKAELEEDFISAQTGDVISESGATLPGTPEHVLSFSLDKTWQVSADADVVARVGGYYQSEAENYINDTSRQAQEHDSFWLWNASATLLMDNWRVSLYGKNLGDEDGVTGSFPSSWWGADTGAFENWYGNSNMQMITQPRTIGANVSYRF